MGHKIFIFIFIHFIQFNYQTVVPMRNLIASLNNFSFKCYFLFFTIIIDYSGYLFDFGCHSFFLYFLIFFYNFEAIS